ncbi:hypothetical protein [Kitasatospora sp. NPDC051914]|uniref:hypothetical protein n=1 Tax=Kitasatospora sp. NPDC051914 TaxID=3154945 RepID=UPI00343DCF2D
MRTVLLVAGMNGAAWLVLNWLGASASVQSLVAVTLVACIGALAAEPRRRRR